MLWFVSFFLLFSACKSQTTTTNFCDRQIINYFCARYESDLRYICRKTVVLITDGATVCDEKDRCATLDLQCLNNISKGTRVSRVPLPSVPSIISTNDGSFLRDVNSVNLLRLNLPPIQTTTNHTPTPVLTTTPTPTDKDAKLAPFIKLLPSAIFYPGDQASWPAVKGAIQQQVGTALVNPKKTMDALQAKALAASK